MACTRFSCAAAILLAVAAISAIDGARLSADNAERMLESLDQSNLDDIFTAERAVADSATETDDETDDVEERAWGPTSPQTKTGHGMCDQVMNVDTMTQVWAPCTNSKYCISGNAKGNIFNRAIDDSDNNAIDVMEEVMQEIKVEKAINQRLDESSVKDMKTTYEKKVVKAEKYELPLRKTTDKWFGSKHNGVVVTLGDGRRLLIIKGYEFGRPKSTEVLDAAIMSNYWKQIDSKTVDKATVKAYINECELGGNSRLAASKMMKLN